LHIGFHASNYVIGGSRRIELAWISAALAHQSPSTFMKIIPVKSRMASGIRPLFGMVRAGPTA